ncbi:Oidioi.mRNA.OKI2018_I69.PAR.g9209.t1.cds [Oikopleura dioica]|uniref:Oidioi.mRNA.OKI2018_I69.PAR.g9209.t1.cds n=1 Tax=Oikopleura dioica TaxID=34765 RepID=A0ABN7RPZ3_OIKDI|nr:Oidioi.mRNA.OKI2018_I69.PAR.g9209.t1.cds [Oikopleura dioica]
MSNFSSAYDKLFIARKKPDLIHEYIRVLVTEKQRLEGLLEQTNQALEKATSETTLPRVTDCGENEPVLEDVSSDEENCDDIHTDSSEAGSEINDSDASDPDFFTNNDCAMPCMHQSHYIWLARRTERLRASCPEGSCPYATEFTPYQHPLYRTSNNSYGAYPMQRALANRHHHGIVPLFSLPMHQIMSNLDGHIYAGHGFNTSIDRSKVYDQPRL